MLAAVLAISAGAALGALSRWGLALAFNAMFPTLPPGTLAANVIGGYLIGVAVAFFSQQPQLPPEVRLFVVTGFLGGLTTFSTFSAEVMSLIQQGRLGWALGAIAIHVSGSLLATFAGMASVWALRR